ncbi:MULTISPECIES: hypothetical protein [Prochlorococcus]|uniref:hypothetical protein n=1 Tax=Prochlorococcus TaxID=1218 RepID=UPI000533B75D|nr:MULTISPECIES: hypothetical protein [Prochlorococcus]KGG14205.1 hypothetical protein EV05_0096 [Prochlorococcus sp. MIT 0601]
MQKETLYLKLNDWYIKRLRSQIADMLRSISDRVENKNDDVDLMADVDDQRAHHFWTEANLDEWDDSA